MFRLDRNPDIAAKVYAKWWSLSMPEKKQWFGYLMRSMQEMREMFETRSMMRQDFRAPVPEKKIEEKKIK